MKLNRTVWLALATVAVLSAAFVVSLTNGTESAPLSDPAPPSISSAAPAITSNLARPSTRVTGESARTDETGDVRDGDYHKAKQRWPGTDLVRVTLEADAGSLIAVFTASADFPVSVSGSDTRGYWALDVCSRDDNECISLRAKIWDTGWSTDTVNFGSGPPVSYVGTVRVDGKRMILSFSRDQLPSWLDQPFKWRAGSEWNATWKDAVPNDTSAGKSAWVSLLSARK